MNMAPDSDQDMNRCTWLVLSMPWQQLSSRLKQRLLWEHAKTLHSSCSRAILLAFNGQLLPINLLLAEYSSHNGIGPGAGLARAIDLHKACLSDGVQNHKRKLGRRGQVLVHSSGLTVQAVLLFMLQQLWHLSGLMNLHAA